MGKSIVLITGSAGFVGAHMAAALSGAGMAVIGVDNLNAYYDPALKRARLNQLCPQAAFHALDIADDKALAALCNEVQPDLVIHLAAQAGVRHSFKAPMDYARSNLTGQVALLEAVKNAPSVKRLIYASSSSVYSGVPNLPFREDVVLGTPKSLYAATKIADEVLCETYSALHQIDMIGLRFFTVYGPWGRPDMAYWTFANAILEGRPLKLFNHGNVRRDFTYIDDITTAIVRMAEDVAGNSSAAPRHRVYNIGNHAPVPVGNMIEILEDLLGNKAIIQLADLPPGDMVETFADVDKLRADYGFVPDTSLETGLARFADWLLDWRQGTFS